MSGACGPDSTMPDPAAVAGQPGGKVFLTPVPTGSRTVLPARPRLPGQPLASPCSGGCPGDSSVVDFEGLGGAGTIHQLTTQFASLGVEFSNALAAVAPAYDSVAFPPRSGVASSTADVFAPGGPTGILYVDLLGDAVRVKGYLTSVGPMTLQCFNAADSLVGETPFAGDNIGHPVANQPVEVSAPGIRRCQFNGPDNQYSLDDLTVFWNLAVPTLSCDSVIRGQTGTCTVAGADSVIKWLFDGPYEVPLFGTGLDRSWEYTTTDTVWQGKALLSGTVRVILATAGTPDTLTAPWHVQARTGPAWRWGPANWELVPDGNPICNYADYVQPFPDSGMAGYKAWQGINGYNRRWNNCTKGGSIEPDVRDIAVVGGDSSYAVAGATIDSATTGPNSGLYFVKENTFRMRRVAEMDKWFRSGLEPIQKRGPLIKVLDPTDYALCSDSLGLSWTDSLLRPYEYNLSCRGFNPDPWIAAVLNHEGYGSDPAAANGHEARRQIAAAKVENDPRALSEPVVHPGPETDLRDELAFLLIEADVRISDFASDTTGFVKDNYINYPVAGDCGYLWTLFRPDSLHTKVWYKFVEMKYYQKDPALPKKCP